MEEVKLKRISNISKFISIINKLIVFVIGALLTLVLFFSSKYNLEVYASNNEESVLDNKVICKATIDEDFADNEILVTLNSATSRKLRDYTIDDFTELNLLSVKDLTAPTTELVREQIAAERNGNWARLQGRIDTNMLIKVDEFRQILCLTLCEGGKHNVLQAIKTLETRDDIIAAEPNYRVQGMATPHPTLYNELNQWGLNHVSYGIKAQEAWNITTGSNTVIVGIVDSGIDATHPDLINRIHRANPHNINTTLHKDYVDGSAENNYAIVQPVDYHLHGTHVSGIVGAQWNNPNSISGIAWDVILVSLRVLDANNYGWNKDFISAIAFAGAAGIRLLNISISGDPFSTTQQNVIRNYPGLIVCCAGNQDRNCNPSNSTDPGVPIFPGSYDFDNILTVGATAMASIGGFTIERRATSADGWLNGSNWGSTAVDLFAPGTNIRSTIPGGGYKSWNGTSMAAPMVTGTVALMLSINPNLTVNQVKAIIMNNVDHVENLSNLCVSGGRLNAFKAVSAVAFMTSNVSNGISITGLLTGFTLPNNTNLELPDRFAPIGSAIQQNVLAIGNSAFVNCAQISEISIPETVTYIDLSAFDNCTNLKDITLPQNLTSIGSSAFKGCASLTSITIPNSVTNIGSNAFENCTNLKEVYLSNNLTNIGNSAFKNCTSLDNVMIPDSVTTIGSNAFLNTNEAYIYLFGKTTAPTSFDSRWNPSNNPVYLSGIRCTHSTTTLTSLSSSNHGQLCDTCRTATNIVDHSFTHNPTWFNYHQHSSHCECGAHNLMGHVVSSDWNGIGFATCLICGGPAEIGFVQNRILPTPKNTQFPMFMEQDFGNGSYILSNGVIVVSGANLESFCNGTLLLPNRREHCNHFKYRKKYSILIHE